MQEPAGRFLIVGAGPSGATLARFLAEQGLPSLVIEQRNHVAGNCHTQTDRETGILVHHYGPHIFHTDDDQVWSFVGNHAEFVPYRHQVLTTSGGKVYSLPINLLTINQFFGACFSPGEAEDYINALCAPTEYPRNFEEQALSTIGRQLYETFFRGYTRKQWGMDPTLLPASLLKRLPLRFNYDNNYFHHRRQAMPRHGYTAMIEKMLKHHSRAVHAVG